jgi:hypothetical protein
MDAEWLQTWLSRGYDIGQLLELIRQAREELDRGAVPRIFPLEIIADHRKLEGHRINPSHPVRIPRDDAELTRRREAHPLVPLLPELLPRLGVLPGSERMLALVDRDGFVLEREGDSSAIALANSFGLVRGINWAGVVPSTNAVRSSVKLKRSVLMLGHQHYRRNQCQVACFSTRCTAATAGWSDSSTSYAPRRP